MERKWIVAASLLLAVPALPGASAQEYGLYSVELEFDRTLAEATISEPGVVRMIVHDRSLDGPGTYGGPSLPTSPHQVTIDAKALDDDPGWQVQLSDTSIPTIYAGDSKEVLVRFLVLPSAKLPLFSAEINVTLTGMTGEKVSQTAVLSGRNPGIPTFNALGLPLASAKPGQVITGEVRVSNLDLQPKYFDLEVADNPCGFSVVPPTTNLVDARSTDVFPVNMEAPMGKVWYFYEACSVRLRVYPTGEPGQFQSVVFNIQLNGGYLDPVWLFWAAGITAAAVLLFFFLKRRKQAIEEEILGKPQKPWTIPAEALYLEALKERDPRAAYVVRHYLMEDEYRSALLWFRHEKRATRGSRKKERLIVKVEHDLEKRERKCERRIAKPLRKADKYEAKLQRKLDRRADKAHRKARKKHGEVVRRLVAAHDKAAERALQKWEAQARKARKKGLAEPEKPDLSGPDLPDEPMRLPAPLSDHRWQRRADRYRARMERKQTRLEARYERVMAREQAKIRKKARRLAKKIDDPGFLSSHEILRD